MPGPPANPGDKFIYDPSHGMHELDLVPGTEVTFLEYDADSEWPLVEWVDGVGIDRITTIEPDAFSSDFITA
jgi:hypothetical protein